MLLEMSLLLSCPLERLRKTDFVVVVVVVVWSLGLVNDNDKMSTERNVIRIEQEVARNLLHQMQEHVNKLEAISQDFKSIAKRLSTSTQSDY